MLVYQRVMGMQVDTDKVANLGFDKWCYTLCKEIDM